jgi:dTDP-4-dehydrorhamnose 3,5-epimerase
VFRMRALAIPDVRVYEPRIFADDRGSFLEAWNPQTLAVEELHEAFVQDNLVRSRRGVVRGLHFQLKNPQGKFVRCTDGEIVDVAVDIRRSSPTFGQSVAEVLSAENGFAIWVPPGFAHGYAVLSESATVYYKCTQFYEPASERVLLWNDPAIGIEWPLDRMGMPVINARDAAAPLLAGTEVYP